MKYNLTHEYTFKSIWHIEEEIGKRNNRKEEQQIITMHQTFFCAMRNVLTESIPYKRVTTISIHRNVVTEACPD